MFWQSLWSGLKRHVVSTYDAFKKGSHFVWKNLPSVISGIKTVSHYAGQLVPSLKPIDEIVQKTTDAVQTAYDYVNTPEDTFPSSSI